MDISIRSYKPTDYSQVKALLKEAGLFAQEWESEENLAGMIKRDPDAIQVVVDGEQIIANVFLVPYGPKVMHLYRLTVKKEYRNQGIASKLLDHVQEIVQKKGYDEVDLFADQENTVLQQFYKKRGFVMSENAYFSMWKEFP